jgi:CAAX prenyl protease-like protein
MVMALARALNRAAIVRIAPFALFMLLPALAGIAPADGAWGFDPRWAYGISVLLVAALMFWWRREYGELFAQTVPSWRETALAAATGVAVFWLWIQLDEPWMRLGEATSGFRPVNLDGELIWALVLSRWLGATLLVPVMEELFWRSFLMRWLRSARFEAVLPHQAGIKAVVLSTFLFTLAHTLWLGAVVAGLAYAWLYMRTGKLWVAIVAHAVTNALLGGWVVLTGSWGFW